VGTALAHRMLMAAEVRVAELGMRMAIAICDEAGVLETFSRMDGAPAMNVQVALGKAFTQRARGCRPTAGTR
jgi:uncharacterized protein GlcG (DUF336 family)